MKKIILVLLVFFHANAFSQLNKEQWLIGGNGLFSHLKSKELSITSWQVSPAAGYFLIDKLAAGIRPGYNSDRYTSESDNWRSSTISLAPFLRYYIFPVDQKVNVFGETAFGYSWTRNRNFRYPGLHRYEHYNFSFMSGLAIFLNQHTSFEITAGYSYLSRGPIDTTITNKLQVGIGLQIHFGKKKT